jgi:hypothetical protein
MKRKVQLLPLQMRLHASLVDHETHAEVVDAHTRLEYSSSSSSSRIDEPSRFVVVLELGRCFIVAPGDATHVEIA